MGTSVSGAYEMRINHNINADFSQSFIRKNTTMMAESLKKLSTGLRINSAKDDASGLSVSEGMKAQIKGMDKASDNVRYGQSLLQIAEGAVSETEAILQRMRELSVQSSNDTLTSTDRSYLDNEFTALKDEIDRIVGSTTYNGIKLLTGDANSFGGVGSTSSVLHIGANNTSNDKLTIQITGMSTGSLSLATIGISSGISARTAINSIDKAISSVNALRSDLGAYHNRLEHTLNNLDNQKVNMSDAMSRITDVDFAKEMTEFSRRQILQQSSMSMLAQAQQMPNQVLSLLR